MKKGINGVYIVFSDVQGSFNYLEKFFKATKNMKKEGYICLGDIVQELATFPDNRCIEAVKENTTYCVRGNHENRVAKETKQKIGLENLLYINKLPLIKDLGNVLLFHSSIKEKDTRLVNKKQILEEWEYIKKNYPNAKYALFGHSHKKGAYTVRKGNVHMFEGEEVQLNPNELNLINPGGIGLLYGFEKTFARININTGVLRFFTLEEAEEMAKKTEMINEIHDQLQSLKEKHKKILHHPRTSINKLQNLTLDGGRQKDKNLADLYKKMNLLHTNHVQGTQPQKTQGRDLNILKEMERVNETIKKYYNTQSFITEKKY